MIEPSATATACAVTLTDRGATVLEEGPSDAVLDTWRELGVAQLESVVDPDVLNQFVVEHLAALRAVATPIRKLPTVRDGVLEPGGTMLRVDPSHPSVPPAVSAEVTALFSKWGLEEAAREIAVRVRPYLEQLAGFELVYQKVSVLIYDEGDYISPHTDATSGDRLNVQFPYVQGAAAALRVYTDRALTFYDTPGCMRILGPAVWHEVVPLLRIGEVTPLRVNVSLRFDKPEADA